MSTDNQAQINAIRQQIISAIGPDQVQPIIHIKPIYSRNTQFLRFGVDQSHTGMFAIKLFLSDVRNESYRTDKNGVIKANTLKCIVRSIQQQTIRAQLEAESAQNRILSQQAADDVLGMYKGKHYVSGYSNIRKIAPSGNKPGSVDVLWSFNDLSKEQAAELMSLINKFEGV